MLHKDPKDSPSKTELKRDLHARCKRILRGCVHVEGSDYWRRPLESAVAAQNDMERGSGGDMDKLCQFNSQIQNQFNNQIQALSRLSLDFTLDINNHQPRLHVNFTWGTSETYPSPEPALETVT